MKTSSTEIVQLAEWAEIPQNTICFHADSDNVSTKIGANHGAHPKSIEYLTGALNQERILIFENESDMHEDMHYPM